jgi:hypothetical protein
MPHSSIAEEIIALKNKDIALGARLVQKGQLGEGYHEEMQALHNQNAAALKAIIATIGYPTPEKVGKEASEAAWLIYQERQTAMEQWRRAVGWEINHNRT